jgi:hypothetical protein
MVSARTRKFKVGDFVKIVKIPSALKDSAHIDTPGVFQRVVGKTFRVEGFNALGHLELVVAEHHPSSDTYESDTIWIEPQFVTPVSPPA